MHKKHSARATTFRWALGMAVTIFVTLTFVGCALQSGGAERSPAQLAPPPIRILYILDVSGSVSSPSRVRNVQFMTPTVRTAIGHSAMCFCVFDTDVREIGTPDLHNSGEFFTLMRREFLPLPGGQGTYFAPIAGRIVTEAAQAQQAHQRLVVVCLTDGGFNDLDRISELAMPLGQLPALDCLCVGPLTYETNPRLHGSFYDAIKGKLAGFPQKKLIVFPNDPQVAGAAARSLENRVQFLEKETLEEKQR